jgi:hypothetical protein
VTQNMPVPASGVAGKSGMACRDPAESGVLETHGSPRAFVSGEARHACPVRSPFHRSPAAPGSAGTLRHGYPYRRAATMDNDPL